LKTYCLGGLHEAPNIQPHGGDPCQ
jgi:hypothetical protein